SARPQRPATCALGADHRRFHHARFRNRHVGLQAGKCRGQRPRRPGQIFAVDTVSGEILHTADIDNRLKVSKPYKKWLRDHATLIESTLEPERQPELVTGEPLKAYQKMFQVSFEEREQVLKPLAESANEAV